MDQQAVQPTSGLEPTPSSAKPAYDRVVGALEKYRGSTIAVPELSCLLGVKTTTLNARFRRERVQVNTVGRTNYIPCELALRLAERHKYALIGWPTLREASQVTSVKQATIKARCEKGQVEGYLDLTKRLRINPAELDKLSVARPSSPIRIPVRQLSVMPEEIRPVKTRLLNPKPMAQQAELSPPPRPRFALTPLPTLPVRFITEKDYGLPETPANRPGNGHANGRGGKAKQQNSLSYDPDRPLSISQCAVGRVIWYGPYEGRILKVLDDPFNPKIQVRFPNHDLPVMREVCLIVEKRKK